MQEEESQLLEEVINYFKENAVLGASCNLLPMTEKEAFQSLQKRNVNGILVINKNAVKEILTGDKGQIDLYLPKQDNLQVLLLKQIISANVETFEIAKAQIDANYEVAKKYHQLDDLEKQETTINGYNLRFYLDKQSLYQTKKISVYEKLSRHHFIAATMIAIGILLFVMEFGSILIAEPKTLQQRMNLYGLTVVHRQLMKLVTLTCILTGVWMLAGILFHLPNIFQITQLEYTTMGIVNILFAVAYSLGIYNLVTRESVGLNFVLVSTIIGSFLSGLFVPLAFFPDTLQRIGTLLPMYHMKNMIITMVSGRTEAVSVIYLITGSIVLFGVSCIANIDKITDYRMQKNY